MRVSGMRTLGSREFRARLSHYLSRAKAGDTILVTREGRPVAMVSAPPITPLDPRIQVMIREGLVRWSGGKPRGSAQPARLRGPSVAQAVIEGRR